MDSSTRPKTIKKRLNEQLDAGFCELEIQVVTYQSSHVIRLKTTRALKMMKNHCERSVFKIKVKF